MSPDAAVALVRRIEVAVRASLPVLGRHLDVRTAALAVATLLVAVAWASYGTGMRAGVATGARLTQTHG